MIMQTNFGNGLVLECWLLIVRIKMCVCVCVCVCLYMRARAGLVVCCVDGSRRKPLAGLFYTAIIGKISF